MRPRGLVRVDDPYPVAVDERYARARSTSPTVEP
jgi:hypothetical protein